jgi:hypothetical protein
MDKPPIIPNRSEQAKAAMIRLDVLNECEEAVKRIKEFGGVPTTIALVKYTTRDTATSVAEVAVWDVTESFAIDEEGNFLSKLAFEDPLWPGVTYKETYVTTIGIKDEMSLSTHLKNVSPRP